MVLKTHKSLQKKKTNQGSICYISTTALVTMMENLYRERTRWERCRERERILNRSIQSVYFLGNYPTSSCLSLSISPH